MFTSNTSLLLLLQEVLDGEIKSGTYVFWGGERELPPDYDPNTSVNSGELIFNYEDKKGVWSRHERCGIVELNIKYKGDKYTVFVLPTGKGTPEKIIYFGKDKKWGFLMEE